MKHTMTLACVLLLSLMAAPAAAQTKALPFTVERAGSGPAMILIPGLLSGGEVWEGTVAHFRGDYDMHVLTLAGFAGAAPTHAEPFLASTRDAIIQYIREQKLERPVLVGHSLGAFLALWVAATAPDEAGAVVAVDGVPFLSALVDTTMTPESMSAQAAGVRTMFAGMSSAALAAQTRLALTTQVIDTAWHAVGARWGATSDAATAGRAIAEMMTTDIRADVARIDARILLMMSSAGMTTEQRAQGLALYRAQLARAAQARVVVAENARHFIMLDDPAFFYSTVASFLRGQ